MNKVVARFSDGRVVKGATADFSPGKENFHLSVATAPAGEPPTEIKTSNLKALFFVKDLVGDPEHVEQKVFDPTRPPMGRKIKVVFYDGEVLVGTTQGYQPERQGFFLVPADPTSNMERCYVVAGSTLEISFL
jgi:hypothetical protein